MSALAFKILSYNIVNIDANQRRILVVTLAGDAIELNLSEYSYNKIGAKKISSITKINGHQKGMCVLNQSEKSVMIGGDMGVVCTYDIESHDLIDVWNVGDRVTALACLSLDEGGSFIVAAGTNQGNLIIRQDWEEIVPRHHECGIKTINDVKFSKSGALIAVASVDKNVYVLQYQDSDYMPLAACRLENGFPIALNFSEDS
jgi:microtubule-associated protein-like 5